MKIIKFGFIVLLVSGCASVYVYPPANHSFEKSRSYSLSYEKVWIRAVDWFADHNVTIEKIEKSSGLITAKYLIAANDRYLDCGNVNAKSIVGSPKIDKYVSLNVTVRSIDQSTTKVNVNVFGEYQLSAVEIFWERTFTASGRCVSTGKLEENILAYIGS